MTLIVSINELQRHGWALVEGLDRRSGWPSRMTFHKDGHYVEHPSNVDSDDTLVEWYPVEVIEEVRRRTKGLASDTKIPFDHQLLAHERKMLAEQARQREEAEEKEQRRRQYEELKKEFEPDAK